MLNGTFMAPLDAMRTDPVPGSDCSTLGSRPAEYHRDVMAGASSAPPVAPLPLQWPLVGRHEELDLFAASLDDPRSHGFVIHGDAGVGKTRLADQCLAVADRHGRSVSRATATEGARHVPLGALAHVLPPDIGDERCDLVAIVSQVRPILLEQAANGPIGALRRRPASARQHVGDAARPARRCRPVVPRRHGSAQRAGVADAGGAVAPRPSPAHRSRRPRSCRGRHLAPPRPARSGRGEHDHRDLVGEPGQRAVRSRVGARRARRGSARRTTRRLALDGRSGRNAAPPRTRRRHDSAGWTRPARRSTCSRSGSRSASPRSRR